MPFEQLYMTLCRFARWRCSVAAAPHTDARRSCDSSLGSLMLYTVLHSNMAFLDFVLSRADLDALVSTRPDPLAHI